MQTKQDKEPGRGIGDFKTEQEIYRIIGHKYETLQVP